jgi:uncharacterized membrane protein YfcA
MASASVHLAEIGTTAASAISHVKMGNVDKTVLRRIALPGAIGAFAGATVLSGLSTSAARPWASAILFVLGFYVLFRYLRHKTVALKKGRPGVRFLAPLGLVGGFIDATGGGGWGPVTTPALLANGRMAPNRVIGTMNTAEFVVAVAASAGFLLGLGLAALNFEILIPLMLGGLIAAPIGAWIANRMPMRIMGVAVGGMIIFTNALTLMKAFGVPGEVMTAVLVVIGLTWAGLVAYVTRAHLKDRRQAREPQGETLVAVGRDGKEHYE